MPKLSVAIIVRNEQAHLPRWLAGVKPVADEIVAVDSGSTDRTVEILRQAGARVEHRDWTGYADQRNYLADLCTGDWILMLDADEVIGPRFREALQEFKAGPEPEFNGYKLAARIWFFGHWLRFGGFYPEWNLRLYRKGAGRWAGQEVHERVDVDGPVGRMYTGYSHFSYDSVADYRARSARYALAAGQRMLAEGKRAGRLTGAAHAAWTFVYRYLIRLGFLDGRAGWWAAWLEAGYTWKKYAHLADLRRGRQG